MAAERNSIVFICSFLLHHTNIFLHCGCFYGLHRCLFKRTNPQLLIVFGLNAIQLVRNVLVLPLLYDEMFRAVKLHVYRRYLRFNEKITGQLFHYLLILYLIANMILVELLMKKYKRQCTITRTKLLLAITAVFCFFFGSIVSVLAAFGFSSLEFTSFVYYLQMLLESIFIVLVFVFYYVLCVRTNKRALTLRLGRTKQHSSCFWKAKRRGILISLLIVMNFGLTVIPKDVIDTMYYYTTRRVPILWIDIRLFITTISDLIDVVLYLLFNKRFRLVMTQILKKSACLKRDRRRFRNIALTKVSPTVITPSCWGTPTPTKGASKNSRYDFTSPGITSRADFPSV